MDSDSKTTFTVDRDNLQVVITRVFDAPRELVFKACTDAAMIPQWWGPAKYTTVVDKLDLRVGGKWRFVQKDNNGQEFAFNGEYKEVTAPDKLVYTFEFEPMPGHVLTESIVLEDQGEKTLMTDSSHYANIQDLEGMVGMDMEGGAREGMVRLAELVEKQ
ncbi:MAG: SRPBCC family protein [bacterium]|nr:SRPBCC family protein [bacterium]